MTASKLAKELGGKKYGNGWMAHCPAHDDQEPSLSITANHDGKVLFRCHAGCDQDAVIDALRARRLWTNSELHRHSGEKRQPTPVARDKCADESRTKAALNLWHSSGPLIGTLAETYLCSRGLTLPPPATLRFHASLKHPSAAVGPAMVALVTQGSDGAPLGVHRTFLAHDGAGKAAVAPDKMMLGPCRGGAVRLAEPGDVLMVGEGIETCLAAMQATGHPAWAALSISGLLALDLPGNLHTVIVLADGDAPGEAAAKKAALRFKRDYRHVRIARPPYGFDFNDILMGRASRSKESVT